MEEYVTKSGATLTDDDFERMAEEAERGEYPGVVGTWLIRPQGRPRISEEELVTIAFKVPRSERDELDRRAASLSLTRSQFMRDTLEQILTV